MENEKFIIYRLNNMQAHFSNIRKSCKSIYVSNNIYSNKSIDNFLNEEKYQS